jgi:glycosyltransferase involved in cell wall biosynthesis
VEVGPEVLVVVPAWNEAASVGAVVKEILAAAPEVTVLVVDDGSTDRTAPLARAAGAEVITNLFNLGVGGAVRVGIRFALARGFRAMVQLDSDGQHDPGDIVALLGPLDAEGPPQVVIGARFAGKGEFAVRGARRFAMRLLARYLSRMTRAELSDVTSGFRAHNRAVLEIFARTYPADYLADTVESLVIASRAGAKISQVPVAMRPRYAGRPSQSAWRAVSYLFRVVLTLALAIIRRRPPPPNPEEGPPCPESTSSPC